MPLTPEQLKAAALVQKTFEGGSNRVHRALIDSAHFRLSLVLDVSATLCRLADVLHEHAPRADVDRAFLIDVDYLRQCEPWFPRAVKFAFELAGIDSALLFQDPSHLADDLEIAADDSNLRALERYGAGAGASLKASQADAGVGNEPRPESSEQGEDDVQSAELVQQEPPPAAGDANEPERPGRTTPLPPYLRRAVESVTHVESIKPDLVDPELQWAWLQDNGCDAYETQGIPSCETWRRYVREARR